MFVIIVVADRKNKLRNYSKQILFTSISVYDTRLVFCYFNKKKNSKRFVHPSDRPHATVATVQSHQNRFKAFLAHLASTRLSQWLLFCRVKNNKQLNYYYYYFIIIKKIYIYIPILTQI